MNDVETHFMPYHPAKMLELFFGLQQRQIDDDLAAALTNPEGLSAYIRAYRAQPIEKRTAEDEAIFFHNWMLKGHVYREGPRMQEDMALFVAAQPAQFIADEASRAAHDQGRLAELSAAMQKIEEREGLGPNEFWAHEEGPEDYENLRRESDVCYRHVEETVFLQVLRRYRYHEIATLYEQSRMKYEVMREVGRRLFLKPSKRDLDVERSFENHLLLEFGREAFDLLYQRLKAAGYEGE